MTLQISLPTEGGGAKFTGILYSEVLALDVIVNSIIPQCGEVTLVTGQLVAVMSLDDMCSQIALLCV